MEDEAAEAEDGPYDEGGDLDEGDGESEVVLGPAAAAATAATAATGGKRSRGKQPGKAAPVAPTVSEQAVHINDRASAIFVIVVVGVFVAIFLNALVLGQKGMFSGLFPTPVVTEAPEPTDSPEPSASASASAAASPSGSAAASPSAAPSASPSAVPSASPSAAPSAAPSASPSASPAG